MRGLGWSLVAVLLVLQARAAAQHLEWRRIDRWGNVVLDLSKERGILDVEERNGLIAVRYEQGYRLFRAADGAPIPGWFSKVSFNRTRTGAIRKRPTGLHYFDLQGRDTLAPYWKAGLEPLRELNRDLVVAHDKKKDRDAVYDRNVKKVAVFDPFIKRYSPRRFVNGLAIARRDKLWGAIDTKGRVVIPMMYDKLERKGSKHFTATKGKQSFTINHQNEWDVPDASISWSVETELFGRVDVRWRRGKELPYELWFGRKRVLENCKYIRVRDGVEFAAVHDGEQAGLFGFIGTWIVRGHKDAWIDKDGFGKLHDQQGRLVLRGPDGKDVAAALVAARPGLRIERYLGKGSVLVRKPNDQRAWIISVDPKHKADVPFRGVTDPGMGRWSKEGILPVSNTKIWGAVDLRGDLVIALQFDTLLTTWDGRLLASKGDESFYIDAKGKRTGEPPMGVKGSPGTIRLLNPGDMEHDRRRVLMRDGEPISREYDYMQGGVMGGPILVGACGARGIIDRTGRELIPLRSDHKVCELRKDGSAVVRLADSNWFSVDQRCVRTVGAYSSHRYIGEGTFAGRQHPNYAVTRGGRVLHGLGPADRKTPIDEVVGEFGQGICAVLSRARGKWGGIDWYGRLVIPFQYTERFRFTGGKAVARRGDVEESLWRYDFPYNGPVWNLSKRGATVQAIEHEGRRVEVVRLARPADESLPYLLLVDGEIVAGPATTIGIHDGVPWAALNVPGRGRFIDFDGTVQKLPFGSQAWVASDGCCLLVTHKGQLNCYQPGETRDLFGHRELGSARYLGNEVFAYRAPNLTLAHLYRHGRWPVGATQLGHFGRDGLCPAALNRRPWGAVDATGKFVIPPQYDVLMTTSDGRLLAMHEGESFYIDKNNRRTGTPPAPGRRTGIPVCLDRAALNLRWVLQDADGETITREYTTLRPAGPSRYYHASVGNRYGIIDNTGRTVAPFTFDHTASVHADGTAVWKTERGLKVLDSAGRDLAARARGHASGAKILKYLGEGLVHARWGKKHGVIGRDGIVLETHDPAIQEFSEGLAAVRGQNGKWGAIDVTGRLVIPFEHASKFAFSGGTARVDFRTLIDRTGAVVAAEPLSGHVEKAGTSGQVLVAAGRRSRVCDKVTRVPDRNLAVVRNGTSAGLIDFHFREIIPTGRYSEVVVGDPWSLVRTPSTTIWGHERDSYAFVDEGGVTRLSGFARATAFRGGHAWVAREIRNPVLAQFADLPEEWFTDNRTVRRRRGYRSVKTTGRYALVLSGTFTDGKLQGNGTLRDPERGLLVGRFEDGELVEAQRCVLKDGRVLVGRIRDWKLRREGRAYRPDGTLEFEGEWSKGRKWTGTGYMKGEPTKREIWEFGKVVETRTVELPKAKPALKPAPCRLCEARGVVWMDRLVEPLTGTQSVVARYRLYGLKSMPEIADGYCACPSCGGSGHDRR
jgi:hypothetical protein